MRNLVICMDGTGAQPKARGNSNVVRLYSMLDLSDPTKQVAFYDPGVGTIDAAGAWSALGRWLTRQLGMAFGLGLRENLGEVYTWLMQTWMPGDQVYLFGFSRGAYNARALAGLLRTLGLLRPGSENFVPYVVAAYSGDLADMHEIADIFARRVDDQGHTTVPIRYLGAWDTVKAAGFFRRSINWPYTHDLPNVERIRHAMSIDDRRLPFREYLIDTPDDTTRQQVWFAGIHSDVGGTFDDDAKLSTITLKWIAEEAVAQGLLVDDARYRKECAVAPDFATGPIHKNFWTWRLLGSRRRPVAHGAAVHASVEPRLRADPGYAGLATRGVRWVDERWVP